MTVSDELRRVEGLLAARPRKWLVSGVAGFIGSNTLEALLRAGQEVVGLDDLSTGSMRNLESVRDRVEPAAWARFRFVEGDIRDRAMCARVSAGVEVVLHEAALGSTPRSFADPLTSNDVNVTGSLNMLVAAREAGASLFIYAASSSTYGDHTGLPKVEDRIGRPLSPYGVTKYVNELYADILGRHYGLPVVGLRYFNVFGPRQNPAGEYAAVIPRWIASMIRDEPIRIFGDGETSRDFCYVENVVLANLLGALAGRDGWNEVYNIATGGRTTLNGLFALLRDELRSHGIEYTRDPVYEDFRPGDVRHSQADVSKAERLLGYRPPFSAEAGIRQAVPWYLERVAV